MTHPDIEELLPLSRRDFHILLELLDGECHGYGLVKAISARTGGKVRLDPAYLYRATERMIELGLVEDAARRRAPDSARVRRYFRITELGRRALAADAERLQDLVAAVRAKRLISDAGSDR